MTLQKAGGIAGIIAGLTYVVGFVLLVSVLAPMGYGGPEADSAAVAAFAAANPGVMIAWHLTIYVLNGLALTVLAAALFERLRPGAPGLALVSLVVGGLWATLVVGAGMLANVGIEEVARLHATDPEGAAALFEIMSLVENGLGGGNEIAGGVWVLLLGFAGLASAALPRALAYTSLVIGFCGLLTVLPFLGEVPGAIFGLGFIAWFFWTGALLLRGAPASAAGGLSRGPAATV